MQIFANFLYQYLNTFRNYRQSVINNLQNALLFLSLNYGKTKTLKAHYATFLRACKQTKRQRLTE